MKQLLIFLVCISSSFAFATEDATADVVAEQDGATMPASVEDAKSKKEKAMALLYKRTGGIVRKKNSSKGLILFGNAQNRVDIKNINQPLSAIERKIKLPVELRNIDFQGLPKSDWVAKANANMAIFIIDEPSLDTSLLVAPASKWAAVNVAALAEGDPDAAILERRVMAEMSRAFCYLCGGVSSSHEGMITSAVKKPSDLDKFDRYDVVPLDLMPRVVEYVKWFGVRPFIETTYRRACQDGWAPDPEDQYQKAIWDEFHELPTEPIKIVPESQRKAK